jgi:hypothetical protein
VLPPPPDGAPIADLDERQHWLSQLEVAYQLPSHGLLVRLDGFSVSIGATSLTARVGDDERERKIEPVELVELSTLWTALWSAPTTDTPSVFLRYRGVFRTVGAPHEEALMAWLGRALNA